MHPSVLSWPERAKEMIFGLSGWMNAATHGISGLDTNDGAEIPVWILDFCF